MDEVLYVEYFDGEMSPVKDNTAFGYFDDDFTFQQQAPKIGMHIARNLGFPVHDLEITDQNIYNAIEQAMMKFSTLMNEFKIKEDYFSLKGRDRNDVNTNTLVYPNLNNILKLSSAYATEAGVGGDTPMHIGFIDIESGKQLYNLKKIYFDDKHPLENSFSIREVFHYRHPSGSLGTSVGNLVGKYSLGAVAGQFPFGGDSHSYSLLPMSWDIQRMQSVKMSRQIRLSHLGFRLEGGSLRIFPTPNEDFKLFFQYTIGSEEQGAGSMDSRYSDDSGHIINDPTKIDFTLYQWTNLSPKDQTWVINYAEALTKIILGENRRKFSSWQYPNGDISLNGDALVSDGREDKRVLEEEMREFLLSISKERGYEIENQVLDAQMRVLSKIPLGIYKI